MADASSSQSARPQLQNQKFLTDRSTKFFCGEKKTRRRCWWSFNWFSHASASSAEIAGQPVIGRPDVAPLIESINANEICPCTKEHRSATHFPSANEISSPIFPFPTWWITSKTTCRWCHFFFGCNGSSRDPAGGFTCHVTNTWALSAASPTGGTWFKSVTWQRRQLEN